jgi:hypothetical protein
MFVPSGRAVEVLRPILLRLPAQDPHTPQIQRADRALGPVRFDALITLRPAMGVRVNMRKRQPKRMHSSWVAFARNGSPG